MRIACNRMPIPPLPVELIEEIIAWIPIICSAEEKTTTLLRCSLVSSAWVPSSRHNLFLECNVGPERYDLLLSRALRSSSLRRYLSSMRILHFGDSGADYASDQMVWNGSMLTPLWTWGLIQSCLHWALQCPGSPAGRHCNVPACTISGPHAHFSCPQK